MRGVRPGGSPVSSGVLPGPLQVPSWWLLFGSMLLTALVWRPGTRAHPAVDLDDAGLLEFRLTLDGNLAQAGELSALPGVGPQLAAAIVRLRSESCRPFRDLEDLAGRVPGIGPAKIELLRRHLVFSGKVDRFGRR